MSHRGKLYIFCRASSELKWCTCQIHFILKQQLYYRPASNSASRSSTVVPINATITSKFKFNFSIIICLNKFSTWKQLGLSIFHLCLKPEKLGLAWCNQLWFELRLLSEGCKRSVNLPILSSLSRLAKLLIFLIRDMSFLL